MKTMMLTPKFRNRLVLAGLAVFVLLIAFSLPTRLRVADSSEAAGDDEISTPVDDLESGSRPRTLRRRNSQRDQSITDVASRSSQGDSTAEQGEDSQAHKATDAPLPLYYQDRIALLQEEHDLLRRKRERQPVPAARLIASSVEEGQDSTVVVSALAESANPQVMQQVNLIDGQRPAYSDPAESLRPDRRSRGAWLNGLIEVE